MMKEQETVSTKPQPKEAQPKSVGVSADMIEAGQAELNKYSTGQHPNQAEALAHIYKAMAAKAK